jgi:hypothetical protein
MSGLTAALRNADGKSNVYVTGDPCVNRITLALTNGTGAALQLPPGTPVSYDQRPAGASAVYLFPDGLFANEEIAAFELSAPGWSAATFVDPDSSLRYLVIAPGEQVTLGAGKSLDFDLRHVLVAEHPSSGTATVSVLGAGLTPGQANVPLFIHIAEPPKPPDQPLDLEIDFEDANVYSGHDATLILRLINRGSEPLVPGGGASWGPQPPTFQLTLLYGDELGALTTLTDAAKITGAIGESYGNVWKPVRQQRQGGKPFWIMQPDPNGGGGVIGAGDEATIEFSFTGIRAALPAGVASAVSVAYVSWSGVPGYRSGSHGIPITKHASPAIASFTAVQSSVGYQQPTVSTVLSWTAKHANGVTFDVPGVPDSEEFGVTGHGPTAGGIVAKPGVPLRITAFRDVPAGRLSATTSLTLGAVTRRDFTLPTGEYPVFAPLHGQSSAFVFSLQSPSFASLDTARGAWSRVTDLNALVKPPLKVESTRAAVGNADGSRLHLAVREGLYGALWLLTLDVETRTVIAQAQASAPTAKWQSLNAATVALTPDGTALVLSTRAWSPQSANAVAPYDLVIVSAASLAEVSRHSWTGCAQAGPVSATGADASRVFTFGDSGHAIVDTTTATPTAVATLDLAKSAGLRSLELGVPTADRRRLYVPTFDEKTYDQASGTAAGFLAVVDATTLTLAATVPLGRVQAEKEAADHALDLAYWTLNRTALSADESTVYALFDPSIVTVELKAGTSEHWLVASDDLFTATALAVHGQTVVCPSGGLHNWALSAISLTPAHRSAVAGRDGRPAASGRR